MVSKMGNRGSKPDKNKKGTKFPAHPNIPPESPLGVMLQNWKYNTRTRNKNKGRMIQYYYFEWPVYPIKGSGVFWPKYGSYEDRLCQALNIYVNGRKHSQEESDYAACWFPGSTFVMKENKDSDTEGDCYFKEVGPSWIICHHHIIHRYPYTRW